MSFSSRWSVAVPFLLYVVHACLFGRWIVDDAAISFVYSRNLAAGHGLVAQPGLPPVEGYSNFLWVLLMALFFLLRLFHPVVTPKLVGMALTGGLFFGLHDGLRRLDPAGGAIAFVVLCATAVNTSFTAWTISGLENALYVALIVLLFWLLVRERTAPGDDPRPWMRWIPEAAGAVAAGIAMTRPDGMLYAGLYPLLTLGAEGRPADPISLSPALSPGRGRLGAAAGRIARFAAVALVLYGGLLAFRWSYFGDLQPNTYYAKSAKMSALLRDLLELNPAMWDRLREPVESAAGDAGQPLAMVLIAGAVFLAVKRRLRWVHLALLAFAGCAGLVYILLPGDWMRELRFATPFYPFAYAVAVLLAVDLGRELIPRPGLRRATGGITAAAALGLALLLFVPRTLAYAADPALPFTQIEERIGRRYNHFADLLDLPAGASYLGPDVGGALWASRLRIYDLGGLTDRTVARTLRGHRKEFHDYVFAVARPTFILMHSEWGFAARLNLDPRFRRDYVPLYVEGEPGSRTVNLGNPRQSGVFIRKDAIVGKEAAVEKIRAELAADY